SIFFFSVMFVFTTSRDFGRPASSRTRLQRLSTTIRSPDRVTCWSSPAHSPFSSSASSASAAVVPRSPPAAGARSPPPPPSSPRTPPRWNALACVPPARLGRPPAVQPLGALVPVQDAVREVHHADRVLRLVQQRRLLLDAQLVPLALGDPLLQGLVEPPQLLEV